MGGGGSVVSENLASVRLQVRSDFFDEDGAKLEQFLFADAADARKGGIVLRVAAGDLPQGDV